MPHVSKRAGRRQAREWVGPSRQQLFAGTHAPRSLNDSSQAGDAPRLRSDAPVTAFRPLTLSDVPVTAHITVDASDDISRPVTLHDQAEYETPRRHRLSTH